MRSTLLFAQSFALLTVVAAVAVPACCQQQDEPAETWTAPAAEPSSNAPDPAVLYNNIGEPAANRTAPFATSVVRPLPTRKLPDFNRNVFYKNKLEYSVETGWLPYNIPFVFDFLVGSKYTTWPIKYTLMPNIASLRWQIDNPWGWKPLRGSTEFSFSGSYTAIPRGPETRYFAFDYGIRRYFVQPRWRIVPYVEGRGGVGDINAKGPQGVEYAQGQNLTFTLMVGSGARYQINSRLAVSAGVTYMHVSNFYLSEPRYEDFGINVYGPTAGIYWRIGKPRDAAVM